MPMGLCWMCTVVGMDKRKVHSWRRLTLVLWMRPMLVVEARDNDTLNSNIISHSDFCLVLNFFNYSLAFNT